MGKGQCTGQRAYDTFGFYERHLDFRSWERFQEYFTSFLGFLIYKVGSLWKMRSFLNLGEEGTHAVC